MSKEDTKKHFAELCECIWNKIENQEKMDRKATVAMRRIVAQFAMIAWNMSISQTSYAGLKKTLKQFAAAHYDGSSCALTPLMDAAELKWHDYRDDKELIVSVDVKQINGKPHAVAYFKEERPDIAKGFNAFREFMESPENQERLRNISPEKMQEEMSRIAAEYNAMLPESDDDVDDDDFGGQGVFEYPISYEELEELYAHTLKDVEKEAKQEILKELLEYQPFLAPLCKDAKACFEKSEKVYEKEQKTKTAGNYLGSIPELILTIATACMEDTDLEPYDEESYKEYQKEARLLVKALSKDASDFYKGIKYEPERYLLWFIADKIQELRLPEKEFKKQLSILLAWGLILSETRGNQHPDEYENTLLDDTEEEDYDFDEEKLNVLQLHVELRGYRCSADVFVREDSNFAELHDFLNSLFKRDDDHLYRFECEDGVTMVRDEEEIENDETYRSRNCFVGHHLTKESGAYYLFDYGDEWEHDITVKKIIALDPKKQYPKILKITGEIPEQYPGWDEDGEE